MPANGESQITDALSGIITVRVCWKWMAYLCLRVMNRRSHCGCGFLQKTSDFVCDDLQLATLLKAPWLWDVHTRVPSMSLCAIYVTRLTLVLPGAIQLWVCDHEECLLFGSTASLLCSHVTHYGLKYCRRRFSLFLFFWGGGGGKGLGEGWFCNDAQLNIGPVTQYVYGIVQRVSIFCLSVYVKWRHTVGLSRFFHS